MANLVRKKVTVRGKKRTFQRTVMVKANARPMAKMPHRALKNAGNETNKLYRHSLAIAGVTAGMNAGRHFAFKHDPNMLHGGKYGQVHAAKMIGGAVIGGLVGWGTGRATQRHVSEKNKRRATVAASAAAMAGSIYNLHKTDQQTNAALTHHRNLSRRFMGVI